MNETTSPLDLLRQARVHNLLKDWARGKRLSAAAVAEIRAVHPDFDPQPSAPPAEGEPQISTSPPAMVQEPDGEATAEQIERWAAIYGVKRRQLFRYLAIGRAHRYPAPLDHPVEFANRWWAKPRMHQRCPPNIMEAARRFAAMAPPPAAVETPATTPLAGSASADLDEGSFDDGEEVRIARRLVKKYRDKLDEMLDDPNKAGDVAQWDSRLKDAMKTLKEAKASDRAQKKETGYYRPAIEVDQQIFALLKLLVAMRAKMVENIRTDLRKKFPDLPEDQCEALIAIVVAERSREDEIFRDLSKAPDVFALAA
ncbi:MAG: hypothetical protein ABMA13_23180 [Chthoniobacteraceae bacterium]